MVLAFRAFSAMDWFARGIRRVWQRLDASLRARILIPTSLLFAATLGAMVVAAVQIHGAEIERAARERAELSANVVAGAVASRVMQGDLDADGVPALLGGIQRYRSNIEWVSLLGSDGRVEFSTRPELVGSRPWEAVPEASLVVPSHDPDQYAALRPVLVSPCAHCSAAPVVAGWLELRFSRASERRAKRRLAWTLGLAALPSLLVLLAIAWWLLGREATQPLHRLLGVMKAAASGRYDVTSDEGRPDEMGDVSRGFDAVLSALHKSQAENEALYRQRLERADRFALVGEIATGLAHEIKNPLAGLSGALEILADDLGSARPTGELLGEMRRQVSRLAKTMDRLLGFARPQAPRLQDVDLSACLENVLFLVAHQRAEAGVRIARELASGLPAVRADGGQLEQVFLNLCLNSCQAMAASGGILTARTFARFGEVVVEVRDTGPGIPVEARPHVFEPFFTTRGDGNGLGLSISARIVTEHGGRISFICPPGGGTIFSVSLPIAQTHAEAA